jgi:hypothetical protein
MPATQQAPVPQVPFTQAAHEHVEPFPTTITAIITAAAQVQEMVVPSYGYLRHVFLEVTTSVTGVVGPGVLAEPLAWPFNVLDAITLLDTNGAPLYGPLGGYQTYLANAVGGYAFQNSVKNSPWYNAGVATVPAFGIRIPVEITHDTGLGSLANQNAAAAYKVRFTIQASGTLFSTQPTTQPTLVIRPQLEAWSLPNEVDGFGRPQAQAPPNHGTLQYWVGTKPSILAGNNYTQITRVGNLIRNLVFIARTAAGVGSDTVFPNPAILSWDARQLINETQNYRSQLTFERLLGFTRDAGVFAYSFDHFPGNHCGDDDPTGWLPTVQATRLELDGTSAAAGSMEILVNDVAPVALDQQRRYVETAGSGFHPNPDTAIQR